MAKARYEVRPDRKGGWTVTKAGDSKSVQKRGTKVQALGVAMCLARGSESTVVVHDRHGRISEIFTQARSASFETEPAPPRSGSRERVSSRTELREVVSLLAPGSLSSARDDRQIFVAYPYRLYPSADYRRVYRDLENPFGVKFVFADERITSLHVLQKIAAFIRSSRFGIYDISGWNPNVTLELGLALGLNESTYLAADPSKTDMHEVPADLRRVDRIQYSSYTELGEGLERLLGQEIPVPRTHEAEDQLQALRNETVRIVSENEGLPIGDIARLLRVSIGLAQVVVRPLVGTQLRTEGTRRWTKYFPA